MRAVLAVLLLGACGKASDSVVEEPDPLWDCGVLGSLADPPTDGFDPTTLPDDVEAIDLGVVSTSCGLAEPVPFDVPGDATSVTLLLFGHPGTLTVPALVVDPEGQRLAGIDPRAGSSLTSGVLVSPLEEANPGFPRAHRASMVVPNNDGVRLIPGRWALQVGSIAQLVRGQSLVAEGLTSAVHAWVLVRRGELHEGSLDLALHLSGSAGLTSAGAPHDPDVQGALDALETAFGPVGVHIGEVTYHDLPDGWDGSLYLDLPTCATSPELDALLAAPVEVQPGALNVFFVHDLACDVFGTNLLEGAAGLSNGLPGTPFTGHDGVVVSTRWMTDAPDIWAKVLAHEAGHYLGLFHTSEQVPGRHDPLADTPEGPSDNLMYWYAAEAPDGFLLTPEQGRVIRRHPLVRPLESP
ncbi:MAG: hypothetical protein KC656_00160 [Myxococcales bacterium]|nr:hypothetical protein [Myxococcales bacterium]MCB9672113.1 hypothetical protein [Alphaproteobacteria bacterium]MCB9691566.1 hypothetical protein [Alphaproteobacteria bacterium]